jgi:hypothetical protein
MFRIFALAVACIWLLWRISQILFIPFAAIPGALLQLITAIAMLFARHARYFRLDASAGSPMLADGVALRNPTPSSNDRSVPAVFPGHRGAPPPGRDRPA